VISPVAFRTDAFEFAGRETVTNTADFAENAAES
jgi:hypothetical protein